MIDLVDPLLPNMGNENDRRALVESALFGCSVLNQIRWEGPARTFTVNLVQTLLNYGNCEPGRPAIVMLLAGLKAQVGLDKQIAIDRLIEAYSAPKQSASPTRSDTDKQSNALSFLSNAGLWTADTLNESWTLRLNAAEIPLGDISAEQLARLTPSILSDLIAVKGKAQVDRILGRIKDRCNLIEGWKDALVADEKEKQLGEMTGAVMNARKRDFNSNITATLSEIENDLRGLGFTIDKST